jgi:CubicO group peptidase (beta-lactamase class C family)
VRKGGAELLPVSFIKDLCIHGQWVWIDPARDTIIVKFSSQAHPVDAGLDKAVIHMLRAVAHAG